MTENDIQNKDNIIIKIFDGESIDFIKDDTGKVWISSSATAKGLNIETSAIWKIYDRHKDQLENHTCIVKKEMQDQKRDVRVFDKTAFLWICIRSNSPKAIPFQEWVINVIDEILTKGYYIEKTKIGSSEWNVQILDIMKSMVLKQIENDKKIKQIETKVEGVGTEFKQFKQKYEDEKGIDTRTQRKIKDIVHLTHEKTRLSYAILYGIIKRHFEIDGVFKVPEKFAQKILLWLEQNTAFYKPIKKELENDF